MTIFFRTTMLLLALALLLGVNACSDAKEESSGAEESAKKEKNKDPLLRLFGSDDDENEADEGPDIELGEIENRFKDHIIETPSESKGVRTTYEISDDVRTIDNSYCKYTASGNLSNSTLKHKFTDALRSLISQKIGRMTHEDVVNRFGELIKIRDNELRLRSYTSYQDVRFTYDYKIDIDSLKLPTGEQIVKANRATAKWREILAERARKIQELVDTYGPKYDIALENPLSHIISIDGGSLALVVEREGKQAKVLDLESGEILGSIPHAGNPNLITAGGGVVAALFEGRIKVFEARTQKLIHTIDTTKQGGIINIAMGACSANWLWASVSNKLLVHDLSKEVWQSHTFSQRRSAGKRARILVSPNGEFSFSNLESSTTTYGVVDWEGRLSVTKSTGRQNVGVGSVVGNRGHHVDIYGKQVYGPNGAKSEYKTTLPNSMPDTLGMGFIALSSDLTPSDRRMVKAHASDRGFQFSDVHGRDGHIANIRCYWDAGILHVPKLLSLVSQRMVAVDPQGKTLLIFDVPKPTSAFVGGDEIYVLNAPPVKVKHGEVFSFKPQLSTKLDDVSVVLKEGPEGAKVSESGVLTWTPDASFKNPARFRLRLQSGHPMVFEDYSFVVFRDF